jgi:hypothetical protein
LLFCLCCVVLWKLCCVNCVFSKLRRESIFELFGIWVIYKMYKWIHKEKRLQSVHGRYHRVWAKKVCLYSIVCCILCVLWKHSICCQEEEWWLRRWQSHRDDVPTLFVANPNFSFLISSSQRNSTFKENRSHIYIRFLVFI